MNKVKTFVLALIMAGIFSCEDDDSLSVPEINGLFLYWDHEVFGDTGRTLRFEATSKNNFDKDYDLEFTTTVVNNTITARLTRSIDNGKCPFFPTPLLKVGDPRRCNASGLFYIPDKDIAEGVYSLKIVMPNFEVTSNLTVSSDKVTLSVPTNTYLEPSSESVYPIPPNLLFGEIVYQGSNNAIDAQNFLKYLTDLGLSETTLPKYPYRHLTVDENGKPLNSNWEPDNYSIGILFKLNSTNFKTVFEKSKEYFNQKNLNIYLYTSNGDQASFSKLEGIKVIYARQ